MAKTFLSFVLFLSCCHCNAQIPLWGIHLGGTTDDDGRACVVAPNGNVYIAGTFTGTMDLDPSPAIYNITSHGLTDIYLSCYNDTGKFLWGFNIGGSSYDGIENITVDSTDNVIITGYFRGKNVNFDPGGAFYLTDQGTIGPVIAAGGDGFVAKFSSAGVFQWANDIGGASVFDLAEAVAADNLGNIYVGGEFHDSMDVDPGLGKKMLNSINGSGFLVKYKPNGQLAWGCNFGSPGNNGSDNTVWAIKTRNGFVYLAGTYTKSGNFNPAGGGFLSLFGNSDGYLAKFDVAGNFQFAYSMSGQGQNAVNDLSLDSLDNIYIAGTTTSKGVIFASSTGNTVLTSPGNGTNGDLFFAKYSSDGQYLWGHILGGNGNESAYGILASGKFLYLAGYFHDTVDFDPSAGIASLIDVGSQDAFLGKYDLDGNYLCAFNLGKSITVARKLAADKAKNLYVCGEFKGNKVDFDPDVDTFYLDNNGGYDAFFVKYDWNTPEALPDGYLTGDTICAGTTAQLTFTATSGRPPYTLVFSHDLKLDTIRNVRSGTVINLQLLDSTTVCKLVMLIETGVCPPTGFPDTATTIVVYPRPRAYAGHDTAVCPGRSIILSGSGGSDCFWYPDINLDSSHSYTPTVLVNDSIAYHIVVRNSFGCTDTASKNIAVIGTHFNLSPPPRICLGDSAVLTASGADIYHWSPAITISDTTSSDPNVWPQTSMTYWVTMTEITCNISQAFALPVLVLSLPDVKILELNDVDCGKKAGLMIAGGASNYSWSPPDGLSNAEIANPVAHPNVTTTYTVIGTDDNGCKNHDTATIAVFYDGNGRLFVPNAFTPNGDGVNDCFKVNIPGLVSNFELSVFDRWGSRVFLAYDYDACWDGRLNGMPAQMDTYFYYFKGLSTVCGSIEGKGDVILIR